jgi:hypothetical protein
MGWWIVLCCLRRVANMWKDDIVVGCYGYLLSSSTWQARPAVRLDCCPTPNLRQTCKEKQIGVVRVWGAGSEFLFRYAESTFLSFLSGARAGWCFG